MMKIAKSVVIGVGKGGVAKTALATTLSALWAAEHKMRVLLVDCDVQASATRTMGLDPVDNLDGRSLTDAVVCGDPVQVVAAPGRPGLDVVVAGRYTKRLAQALVSDPHGPAKFADAFTVVGEGYDRIVIDLPPGRRRVDDPDRSSDRGRVSAGAHHRPRPRPRGAQSPRRRPPGSQQRDHAAGRRAVQSRRLTPASALRGACQEVRQILGGNAEPFDTVVRSAPDAYKRALQHGLLLHEYLAKFGHMTKGEQIKSGISVASNLPAVVGEFRELAIEINDRIANIERRARPAAAP